MEQSVFRVPMATRGMEGVTRFAELPSFGATWCIFTGVSPDESVYVTVDHGGVDPALRRSEVTLGFSSDTEQVEPTNCARRVRCDSSGSAWSGWQVSSETHALDRRTKEGCQALD
jgi:hypothetical protein